jgi:hypothetical protein
MERRIQCRCMMSDGVPQQRCGRLKKQGTRAARAVGYADGFSTTLCNVADIV